MAKMRRDLDQQIQAVRREILLRQHVYPRRVREGHMTELDMHREISNMECVLETLEELKADQEMPLFPGGEGR